MGVKTHCCSLCGYTTTRSYNLDRHTSLVHNFHGKSCAINVAENTGKVAGIAEKVAGNTEKVACEAEKVAHKNMIAEEVTIDGILKYKCSGCYKLYTRKSRCIYHFEHCKQVINPLECEHCHSILSSKYALSRHRKNCIGREPSTELVPKEDTNTILPSVSNNISNTVNVNNNITGGTQNNTSIGTQNINIIAFPSGLQDDNFAFVKDHITPALLASIMKKKPDVAFANYVGKLLEKEENRMIKKHHPNVNYCKVHTGDNQWDLMLDHDAIPVLAHHVTRSSFEDIKKNRQKLVELQIDVDKLRRYIDDINTENDENDNYNLSIQRIKLMLINFTRKWGKDENDL